MNATWLDNFVQRRLVRADPRRWQGPGMVRLELERATVRARMEGRGPRTIVFACDAPVCIEHYAPLFEMLSPRVRMIVLELPGLGFSVPRPGFGYSLDEQTLVVGEALQRLGSGPYTLAFCCVGAYLALLLATREPALIERLILIQAPSWREALPWARRIDFRGRGLVASPWTGQLLVMAGKRRIAQRWFSANASASCQAQLGATARSAYDAGAHFALASLIQSYLNGPSPAFAIPTQPTVVVWGEQDRSHRKTDKRSILEHVPHAEWVSFPGAGHCPEIEAPGEFAALV